jgi:large subunit ribosomal protein L5
MSRLKELYHKEVIPALMKEFGYKNIMEVPKLVKIVLNMGLGEAINNIKLIDSAVYQLSMITGQRPVVTRAKRSIASFKVRKGMPIGCMVTLRGNRMYEFYDRLVNVALPRIRDFKGVSESSFDGNGNFTIGIREQIIFPEVDYDKVDRVKGMNVTIVTTSKSNEEGKALLSRLGMPFRR